MTWRIRWINCWKVSNESLEFTEKVHVESRSRNKKIVKSVRRLFEMKMMLKF